MATIECGFTLKRVRDMIRTYSQMHRTRLFTIYSVKCVSCFMLGHSRTKRAFDMKLKTFFLVSQALSFSLSKQISKNVPDTTFKWSYLS